ncbi:hypothetical protein LCGC14_0579270 [marine sediment metagenome]|uniref:DNA (cytosine-5-)-methyltransferase n=1 Tax=marine sediment metagenome TaxID=412755 RepID=A0A0F9UQ29_9ZZZZ
MTLGSLFSGIGGFELAATCAGIKPLWSNEIDSFCCKVLRKNFDHEIIEKDIREIGKHNLKSVDIITGGFPCQPFSQAGKRKGTKDDRYLWSEMLRVIRELKPSYVIGENVAGLLSMENGKTLENILIDLENEGYRTEIFTIPACAIGAWHRRDRIWIIAYNGSWNTWGGDESKQAKMRRHEPRKNTKTSSSFSGQNNSGGISKRKLEATITLENASNATSKRLERKKWIQKSKRFDQRGKNATNPNHTNRKEQWKQKSNQKELTTIRCDSWWEVEPNVGRVANGIPGRVDRLKGLGNAIVPQVAYELFKVIKEYDQSIHK